MSDQGLRIATPQAFEGQPPHPRRRASSRKRKAAPDRDRFAYRPGNGRCTVERLEERQLLSSDLTGLISGLINSGAVSGSHTYTDVSVGSFLTVPQVTIDLNVTEVDSSRWTGSVSVDATGASLNFDSALTGSITTKNSTDALTGSYTLKDASAGDGSYSLTAQDLKLGVGTAFTTEATPVTLSYDPNAGPGQTLVTIGSATATFAPLNNATATISDLVVDEDGFSLGNATVAASSFSLGGILSATSPDLTFSGVSDTNGTLDGTVSIRDSSVSILANQANFANPGGASGSNGNGLTLTGFTGSYNIGNPELTVGATGATLGLGKLIDATATGVTLDYKPAATSPVTVAVASLTATSPLFPGVTGTITNLQASSAGLSMDNATLADTGNISLGGVFQVDGPTIGVSGFDYSTASSTLTGTINVSTSSATLFPNAVDFTDSVTNFHGSYNLQTSALELLADDINLSFGKVLKVDATDVDVNWDGTNASFTLSTATLTSPELPGVTGSLAGLSVQSTGFDITSASLMDTNSISLGGVIKLDGPTMVSVTKLDYTNETSTSGSSLSGTIGLSFGGLEVLPGSTAFSTTVTNFQGTYNLATENTTLSVGSIVITVGNSTSPILTSSATGVTIVLTPNFGDTDDTVVINVGSATAALNEFSGVEGSVANLVINNTGFSVGSATLGVGDSNGKGTISAFGGKFMVTNPSVTLSNFGYSTTTNAFTAASLNLSADSVAFNQGGAVSVVASKGTSSLNATISFASGEVGHTIIDAGLVTIGLSSYVTLAGTGITIDTSPAAGGDYVQFGSLTASLNVPSVPLTGTATDFALDSNGDLVTLPGFGVTFTTNASSASGLEWPTWLPIQITTLGVSWPKGFATAPTDIDLTLSASVNANFGGAFTLGGSVTDVVIDLGLLTSSTPTFPIVSLQGAGLSVSGDLGGATVSGGAFVSILNLDSKGNIIPSTDTTTTVAKRIFYGGVEGSLQIGSAAGIAVEIGLSQLGPLQIFVSCSVPILLDPESGLAIQSLNGGINFDSSLTTPTSAKALSTSDSYTPGNESLTTWESDLETAVAHQATSDLNTFSQFAQPFTIIAGVTLFDEYATSNAFTLSGEVEVDTMGKLVAMGTLTLGGTSGVSLNAGAFLDLSKVSQGDAQLLFYLQAPAKTPILSVYGSVIITTPSQTIGASQTIDIDLSGEVDLSVPGVQGGIELVGSADFVATPSQSNLELTVSGTASLAPLGQFGELAGQAFFDLNGGTPELYGAFYANIDSSDIPELASLGLQINATGFVEFNTTSTTKSVQLTPPGQTQATTYSLAPRSVILDIPNAKLGYNNVFQIDASLYASFALVTLPGGKVDPELDMTFNGKIVVGPASSGALTLGASGILIINSVGLAASMSVDVSAAIPGVTFDTFLMMTLNTSGKNESFTVPNIADPINSGQYLPGSGQTYTIPGAFTINGTAQTTGPYLAIVGNGEINVEKFNLTGSFDVLVTPTMFRLDINQMSVAVTGLSVLNLTAQGGLLISTSGIAGAILVSAGSGITGTGGFYSITGTFMFEVNTTSQTQTLGGISIPEDSAAVSVSGDVKVGAPGAQFDVSASVTITVSGSGLDLSLYGMAKLGPLGELSVGSQTQPSTLSIDSSGLSGDLTLSGAASPIAGTSLTGSFELMFNTAQDLYMLEVAGNLTVGGGAFILGGDFDLTESSSGFYIGGHFSLSVLGASLGCGSFDAEIYKDSDGSSELALYAGLSFNLNSPAIGGLNFSIMATPSLSINTGSTTQNFSDGHSSPAQTASFDLQNASIEAFGFKASGSLIATITNGGFDIDIPQSDPISLSFLGLGSMQVYGDFNSDGTFSITGSIGYDVHAGPFELYGGIGATITNTGFSAWFDGGAKLDCGALGSVTLASISASITLMTDYVDIAASCHVLGIGFSFNESLGSYSVPAHSPGLAFYNTPSQAAAGSVPTLTASAYNPANNAVQDGQFDWIVTGPDDVRNGNQPYFASSSTGTFTPTLGGPGTYYVSLYEVDGYGTTLLKQTTINVVIIPPVIASLNLQPSYVTTDAPLPIEMDPLINSTNDSLLTESWTVSKNGNFFGSYTGLNPVIDLDPTEQGTANPDVYTVTLTVVDPYNGTTTLTSSLNTLDIYNLTVNDPGDEEITGATGNGDFDFAPANGLLTLRRAIDIINDNANMNSGTVATIHFAPSLAGDTIYLDQEEFFDHGPLGTSNIGFSDLGIEYPTIIDGSAAPGLTITNASGASNDRRLFFVGHNLDDGTIYSVTLTLKNLILKGGDATGNGNSAYGGAIYVTDESQVSANNVTFENNQANAQVYDFSKAQDADGGAIFLDAGAFFTATDCTFSDNSANGSPYNLDGNVQTGNGYGGAIYDANGNLNLDSTTVAYNTVSGNTSTAGAGIYIYGDSGKITFANTIVAKDTGGLDIDVSSYTSSSLFANYRSGNLIETSSKVVPFLFVGITGTDPLLGEFAARGAGGIPTYSLLAGSVAIGAGDIRDLNWASTDERGLPREVGGTVDIGAFERQAYVVTNSSSTGPGSLAEALATDDDGSNITFAAGLGTIIAAYSTTTTVNGVSITTNTSNGPLTISRSVNIIGPGANLLTINGANLTQLFLINPGITVTISGVTISGGMAIGKGGAIDNSGTLTLDKDLISNNTAVGNSNGSSSQGYGGAIYDESSATLNLYGDTFANNLAHGGATLHQASSGYGGAIFSIGNAVINGNDDTFSGNVAEGGYYSTTANGVITQHFAQGFGGAIDSGGRSTTFTNVTLANNSAQDGASGPNTVALNGLASNGADFWINAGSLNLTNSIAADAISGVDIDRYAGIVTGSSNLVMTSVGLPAATPGGVVISTANPELRPLGYYGGTTPTLETIDGSPVIDAALVSALPATDQRGFTRDVQTAGDLGAFQLRHGFVVTSTADSGAGSLRQTLVNDVDETTITFAANLANQSITLSGGPITLTTNITIDASNAPNLTIKGAGATGDRIFVIDSGVNATLKNLTLSGGQANLGGAIYNSGSLSLINDTLSDNTAQGDTTTGLSGLGAGGAVFDAPGSSLTATGSTFVDNKAVGNSGMNPGNINGGVGRGGAIDNEANATLTLVDDTFSGNSAIGGNSSYSITHGVYNGIQGVGKGGGVINLGTARLTNDTFAMNSAVVGIGTAKVGNPLGAEIFNDNGATLTLYNSIAADGKGGAEIVNQGTLTGSNNIVMSETGITTGVVASSADPNLGPLASNGGTTQTYAINPTSAALGGGLASVAPTTDQRGDAREVGGAVDIGSYETQTIPATPSAGGPYIGYYKQSITLDASGTSNPSNSTLTYSWTITGPGGTISTTPNKMPITNVSLLSLSAGTYTVTLVVDDGLGGNHIVTTQSSLTILPALTISSIAPASLAPALGTAFDTADITFAYPVNVATLNANSIALSLDGRPNLLTGGGNPNFQVVAVTGSPETYRISGLAAIMAADGDGQYTLTVYSADVKGAATGVGQGSNALSVSWIYDTTPPSSIVSPLPARSTSPNIVVTVTGSDPSRSAGVITSGVVSYDIWVSTNGGPFVFWTNVPASSPTATYAGSGGDSYGFQSFARDAAGNVEVKSATVETGTYVPNTQMPWVHVASVDTTNQAFLVNLTGSAASGGVLDHVDVYVSVDGGTPELIAKVANTNKPVTYEAIADGNAHNYAFYAVGTDRTGNVQLAPAGPYYDAFVSAAFGAPTANVPIALSIDHGAAGRSFVGSADLIFANAQGLASLISGNHIHLIKHNLDGTGSTPVSVTGLLSVVDHAIEFNFGALGLGGSPDSGAGDGYYEIDIDGISRSFYFDRIFGDVAGDGIVDANDLSLITSAIGVPIPGELTNLDGSDTVTPLTRLSAIRAQGHKLGAGLHLDA